MKLPLFWTLGALIVNALAAWAVGLWLFSPTETLEYIRCSGYWCILLSVVLFVFGAALAYKKYPFIKFKWRRKSIFVLGALIVGTAFLRVHAPTGFTILMDEPVLASTAYSMHLDREVLTPTRAQSIHGVYCLLDGYVDKRPLLFPFLVSLLHDFLGYAYSNPFLLNGILTVVYLGLVFRFGKKIGGASAGLIAILAAVSVPLLGQACTGGGFELLNLVMILLVMHCALLYYESRKPEHLNLLCLSGVLLAQVRYESVIFLFPVCLIIGLVWIRERRVSTVWGVWVAPWLLVPYLWQHHAFNYNPNLWQLFSKPECKEPFSVDYVANNLNHALLFFFDPNWSLPNAPWLALVGLISVIALGVILLGRMSRGYRLDTASVVLGIFILGFIMLFGILMVYYWGQLDDYLVSRLSLPIYIPFIFAPIALVYVFLKSALWRSLLAISLGVSYLSLTLPSVSAWRYAQTYLPSREPAFVGSFINKLDGQACLFLSDTPLIPILYEQNAMSFNRAMLRKTELAQFMRAPGAMPVYVFEVLEYDPASGVWISRAVNPLDDCFVLEPLEELEVSCVCKYRMSLLKRIEWVDLVHEAWPADRKAFERVWISRLP